jgi:nicotinamide-nucleotide amidase
MRASTQLIHTFREKNLTLALAESMTCGLAAHTLASVRGTADVLMGSIVCYSEDVKTCVLHVSPRMIKKYTAESQQVTDALITQLRKMITSDVYAAITGLASEGGSETKTKPVGTVFFSVFIYGRLHRIRKKFTGSPLMIRKKACEFLYRELVRLANK